MNIKEYADQIVQSKEIFGCTPWELSKLVITLDRVTKLYKLYKFEEDTILNEPVFFKSTVINISTVYNNIILRYKHRWQINNFYKFSDQDIKDILNILYSSRIQLLDNITEATADNENINKELEYFIDLVDGENKESDKIIKTLRG